MWDGDDDRYEIRKAALDPLSAEEEVVTSNSMLTGGMAYHDGYLYWGAQLWNRIYKLPEGGGNADVVEVLVAPDVQDIAIDAVGGRMYWGNYDIIYRLNLDGTGNPYGSVFGLTSTGTEVRGLALLRLK